VHKTAQNQFQNAEVGTTVKYQVCSVHTRPVYTTGTCGTGHIGMFGTATIPVPETLVSSAWYQYRYRTIRYVRYDIHTDTVHFGKFDTIWIPVPDASVALSTTPKPVPDTSVSSVRHPCRYRAYRLRTEHALDIFSRFQMLDGKLKTMTP